MLEKFKYYLEHYKQYRYIAAGLVGLIIALLFFIQPEHSENEVQQKNTTEWNHKDNSKNNDNKLQSTQKNSQEAQTTKSKKVMVDIKGAVKHPNVYEMSDAQRIKDVVLKAVPNDKADLNQINLSEKLVDQKMIYIPEKGKSGPNNLVSAYTSNPDNTSTSATQQKVNLNTAKETELTTVTGVGPSKAKAIIEFRESKGSFNKVEQLKEVKGIGEKSFEKLKDYFTI